MKCLIITLIAFSASAFSAEKVSLTSSEVETVKRTILNNAPSKISEEDPTKSVLDVSVDDAHSYLSAIYNIFCTRVQNNPVNTYRGRSYTEIGQCYSNDGFSIFIEVDRNEYNEFVEMRIR